jgi:hypothetical protein
MSLGLGGQRESCLENARLEDTESGRMYSGNEDWQHYGILWA